MSDSGPGWDRRRSEQLRATLRDAEIEALAKRAKSLDRAGACVLSLLITSLCGCAKQVETKDILSPDHSLIAQIQVNSGGGAAVADTTSVYLTKVKSRDGSKQLLFMGSAMSDFEVVWRSPIVLELRYGGGYVTECDSSPASIDGRSVRVIGCRSPVSDER